MKLYKVNDESFISIEDEMQKIDKVLNEEIPGESLN